MGYAMRNIFIILMAFVTLSVANSSDSIIKNSRDLIANGKNVILFFGTKTCPYCDVLRKDFKEDKVMHKLLKENFNVYYIPIDEIHEYNMGDKKPPKKTNTISLKMGFSVKATPQIVMFDENWGKIIQLPGYANPQQMKIFLNYVAKDYYKSKKLGDYLKEMGLM